LIFLAQALIGSITVKDFLRQGVTWSAVARLDSPWFWGYSAYYLGFCLLGTILVWRWGRKSSLPKERQQARIIVLTAFIAIFLSFLNQTHLPALHFDLLPGIPSIIVLIWVFGIWLAIARYKLMALTPSIAAEEIIAHIMDLLILADNKGDILKINRQIQEILGYSEEELLSTPISEMILEENAFLQEFGQNEENGPSRICELTYKAKNGDRIPVAVSGSTIRDKEGEPIGVVVVGHDMRPTRQLQGEIKERMRVEEEVRSLNGELEKRVSLRTRELAIANEDLRYRSEFEQLIARLSTGFINLPSPEIDQKVLEALREVGEFLQVARASIRLTAPEITLEWAAEGLCPREGNLIEHFPWAKNWLQKNENLVIPFVEELPAEAQEEISFLLSEGVHSLVVIPLRSGFLELQAQREEKFCTPESVALLKTVGQILFNALERKQVEEALWTSEQRYRELIENANDIVYTLDLEWNFTSINQAGLALSGYSREEILGMNMLELISLDHIPLVQRMMARKLDGEIHQTTYE
ncbi:MAG TPA: PAS domain S-box protein, partial [Chroococcales cyanobacterium]